MKVTIEIRDPLATMFALLSVLSPMAALLCVYLLGMPFAWEKVWWAPAISLPALACEWLRERRKAAVWSWTR